MRKGLIVVCGVVAAFNCTVPASQPRQTILSNEHWRVEVSPETLEITARPRGRESIQLSQGQPYLGRPGNLMRTGNLAQWDLEDGKITVTVELREKQLSVAISSRETGEFTWPVLPLPKNITGLIWPRAEGCRIPLDNSRWTDYLIKHGEWNTLEGLSIPCWGPDCNDLSLRVSQPGFDPMRLCGAGGEGVEKRPAVVRIAEIEDAGRHKWLCLLHVRDILVAKGKLTVEDC